MNVPPDFEFSRSACREAFNEACFKPRLFETWFNAEWKIGNYPGTEEVARVALDRSIEPIFEWRIRLAVALTSKAHAQGGGRISVSVLPAYLEASKELSEAIRIAPADEAQKWRRSLEETNDSIYRASLDAIVAPLDRLSVIRHLTTFVSQGDLRIRNYSRMLELIADLTPTSKNRIPLHASQLAAVRSSFDDIRHIIRERVEQFPNDDRHDALLNRCDLLSADLFGINDREQSDEAPVSALPIELSPAPISSPARQEQSLNGVLVSSTNVEVLRAPLPDHLSVDKDSPHYVSEYFKYQIGIRFNGRERSGVNEYCVSEGWIKVPSSKTVDRRGKPLLIQLKGTVEPFYKDL